MRAQLSKKLREGIGNRMASEYHDFQPDKSQKLPQGWYVWTSKKKSLWFHIVWVIDPTGDQFSIEIGWSRTGILHGGLDILFGDAEKFFAKPSRERLGYFAGGDGGDLIGVH